jgi:hypothetical protein
MLNQQLAEWLILVVAIVLLLLPLGGYFGAPTSPFFVLLTLRRRFQELPESEAILVVSRRLAKWSKLAGVAGAVLVALSFCWAIYGAQTFPNTPGGADLLFIPSLSAMAFGILLMGFRTVIWVFGRVTDD